MRELEIHPSILATGNLVRRQEVQLSAEVIGKVAAVLVKKGDRVSCVTLRPTRNSINLCFYLTHHAYISNAKVRLNQGIS